MSSDKEQYKKQYSRDYYAKRRADPAFLEQKREYAKKNYDYTRKTIDCPTCRLRHTPTSQTCILLREQVAINKHKNAVKMVDELVSDKRDTELPVNG